MGKEGGHRRRARQKPMPSADYVERLRRARAAIRASARTQQKGADAVGIGSVRNLDTGVVVDVGVVEAMYRGAPVGAFEWAWSGCGPPGLTQLVDPTAADAPGVCRST